MSSKKDLLTCEERGCGVTGDTHVEGCLPRESEDPLAHFRGVAGTVSVRSVEPEGPWRLFLGEYGVATWPSEAAFECPREYAEEVARCVRVALADTEYGPCVETLPRRPTLDEVLEYVQRRERAARADGDQQGAAAYSLIADFVANAKFDVPSTNSK